MIPAAFEYTRPASLSDAVAAVGGGAKVIAGGQSLLPLLKLRLAAVDKLVDIGRLSELRGYRPQPDGGLEIGALTTYADWQAATVMPSVAEAIDLIADVQVRNRGTIGGAIAHADPGSDAPAICLVFDGQAVLRGPGGERVVPLDDFFEGPFQTAIRPDEILVAIRRGPVAQGAQFAYRKLAQPASGYAIVGVAALIAKGGDGRINHARVALTGVHEHAYRAPEVEDTLVGTEGTQDDVRAAAEHATVGVEVTSDIHADAAYRTAMAKVYTARAIEAALGR
ncbi:MAG TPA: xanthine dehydrogenase family protein subunit M [Candidatus Limnocylindrales bacterium]|nr:xanthine dehydrogenase family protein subunit M [Candidatus Limnocylindrales bacterium]